MSLADIFLTPRQQKMLAPLLLNPEHSYRLSELLALSGAGRGASQKHIDNFVEAGVLQEERRGNQRCLQINQAFPLYEELRSICLKSFGLRDGLKSALEPLADQITDAFIFGSVASNTDRADSDIDLMVIGSVPLIPDGHPKCSRDGHPKCSTRDGLDWMLVMGWQDVNFTPWKPKGEGVERLESTFTNDLVDAVWA